MYGSLWGVLIIWSFGEGRSIFICKPVINVQWGQAILLLIFKLWIQTHSVILRYASTWSSPAAILSSRIRRRGSKSPSHSGIVTILRLSLDSPRKIKSQNPVKIRHKEISSLLFIKTSKKLMVRMHASIARRLTETQGVDRSIGFLQHKI